MIPLNILIIQIEQLQMENYSTISNEFECTHIDFVVESIVQNVKYDLELWKILEEVGGDTLMAVGNRKEMTRQINECIQNIVQKVRNELKPDIDVSKSVIMQTSVPEPVPIAKNHASHHTEITDYISDEYYDYLLSINDISWFNHRKWITRIFYLLKISSIRVFDLFMDKLKITLSSLFQIVKRNPHNYHIAMCCMERYNEEFIKSFDRYDYLFFTRSLHYCGLSFNKYVYHNVYCKLNIQLDKCPYKEIFSNEYTYICAQSISTHDVFEYFINLFGINLRGKYGKTELLINHVISMCHYGNDERCKEYLSELEVNIVESTNPLNLLKRMIELTSVPMGQIRDEIENQILKSYNRVVLTKENVDYFSRYRIRHKYPWDIVTTLIAHNKIDELIEIFNYVNIDLKKFNCLTIALILLDVLFSNNEEIVIKFIKYLYNVGYVMNEQFYDKIIDLLTVRRGKYLYLSFEKEYITLDKNIMDGIIKLKYAGSKILFKRE